MTFLDKTAVVLLSVTLLQCSLSLFCFFAVSSSCCIELTGYSKNTQKCSFTTTGDQKSRRDNGVNDVLRVTVLLQWKHRDISFINPIFIPEFTVISEGEKSGKSRKTCSTSTDLYSLSTVLFLSELLRIIIQRCS